VSDPAVRPGLTPAAQRAAALRVRQCALTRTERPLEDLVRFVLGPGGQLAPDLAGRLGGRGVWVTATHAAVDAAARTGVFSKALKSKVKADTTLADLVDRQLFERARQSLSFASKAGLLIAGYVKVDQALDAGTVAVLIQAYDAADDGAERLQRKFSGMLSDQGRPALILRHFGIADLSMALGRPHVVHAALTEGGQTHAVLRDCRRLERFRKNDEALGVSPADQSPLGRLD
jgi:hypothetical protein